MHEFARDVPRGKVHMQVSDIPFSELPHQSRLFLDYIRDPLSLARYYPNAVADPPGLAAFAGVVTENYRTDRDRLGAALSSLSAEIGAGEDSDRSIERLRDPQCVAVVTGQQAGLFSGPLYTVHKALTAIRLAEDISSAGVQAVPVFWAATEDHDLAEVSTTFVPAEIELGIRDDARPVGSVMIDSSIGDAIRATFENLSPTEFTADLLRDIEASYAEGQTVGSAFLRLMAKIFAGRGLIFLDPTVEEIRQLSAPIFRNAIERADEIGNALIARTAELESEGYAAQVTVEDDHFPMFWIDAEGKRRALRRDGDGFRLKGAQTTFSRAELLEAAAAAPESCSPAVMLRPVVQDFLLPTVCYVGGAAEVAYFAQNSEVYRVLDRPATPIVHRQSYTVVEPKQRRSMDAYGLALTDLFSGEDDLLTRVAAKLDTNGTGDRFDEAASRIGDTLDSLDQYLAKLDPTVQANLSNRRRKMDYHISALRKKALRAAIRKNGDAERRVHDLMEILLPNGVLQERSLNVLYFLNKYGPRFIAWLYEATDASVKTHRILDIK